MGAEYDFVNRIYAAFNARELDQLLAAMRPDVAWANGMEGGYVSGHEGVRSYWTRQWQQIDPHVEPRGVVVAPDGTIAVAVHQVVRALDGTLLVDQLVTHVFTLRDGLIQRMEIRPS